jgi:hypothetical protein
MQQMPLIQGVGKSAYQFCRREEPEANEVGARDRLVGRTTATRGTFYFLLLVISPRYAFPGSSVRFPPPLPSVQ